MSASVRFYRFEVAVFFAALLLAAYPAHGDAKSSKELAVFLGAAKAGISKGELSLRELMELRKYSRVSIKARALLSNYYRSCEGNPVKSLEILGEVLLEKNDFTDWQKSLRLQKDAFSSYPPPEKWRIYEGNAELVTEAAMAFADADRLQDALRVCDKLGLSYDGELRLIAHETYGDIQAALYDYDRAVACLTEGIAYAKSYRYEKTEEFNEILSRIRNKLALIKTLKNVPDKMKWYDPDLSEDGLFLVKALEKIDDRVMTDNEYAQLKRLVSFGKSDAVKCRATALMARYSRAGERNPVKALVALVPTILGQEKGGEWLAANSRAYENALREYNIQQRAAAHSREPTGQAELRNPALVLHVAIPPVGEWTIDDNTAECVTEAALCLLDLGKLAESSAAINAVKTRMKTVPYVTAIEAGGYVFMENGQFDKSLSLYEHALKMLPYLLIKPDGKARKDVTGEVGHLTGRMKKAVVQVKKCIEMERYGKGFFLYRQCEELRLDKKDYVNAFLKYAELETSFPKTVYSEAAKIGRIKCLLELAQEEAARDLQEQKGRKEQDLSGKVLELQTMKRERALAGFQEALELEIVSKRIALEELKSIPVGAAAVKEAESFVESFVRENEYGVYRGEAMIALASYYLESVEFEQAQVWYRKAADWLNKVGTSDRALSEFTVPEKARKVSAAPVKEKELDYWGNVRVVDAEAGAIINRRTCSWYLNDLREQCVRSLGFLHFCSGENEKAVDYYAKIPLLDPVTGMLESSGEWNDYRRLKWGVDHGYLYAHPEELRWYSGKQRSAVLLGDFYYVTEQHDRAQKIYLDLLHGKYGGLSRQGMDYPQYAYATCLYWTEGREAAFSNYLKVVANKAGTLSMDRAAYAAGKISREIRDRRIQAEGRALLGTLAKSARRNEFVLQATLVIALDLIAEGQTAKGLDMLKRFPQNEYGFDELAAYYLKQYEKNSKKES